VAATPHRTPIWTKTRLRHRKSVVQLKPRQLKALRDGFAAIERLRDNRGFWRWAGVHGAPGYQCEHSLEQFDSLFLPWHRAYLYQLELALQTQVPEASLPWWDWPASRTDGIPAAFGEAKVDGQPNPLAGAALPSLNNEPAGWPSKTSRRPGPPGRLPTQAQINDILELSEFNDFSLQLEIQLHNSVHGWVGGTMGQVATAAYDPIFWAHHTMVDRLWALWQVKHSSPGPRPGLWNQALRGVDMVVGDTLQIQDLGYQYAGATHAIDLNGGG
jgi:tyrosinase